MNMENITRVWRLDLNTFLYSGSAYQSQGSSAAGHWIMYCICMYVCLYVCIVCMYVLVCIVCMFVCMHVYMYACMYVCILCMYFMYCMHAFCVNMYVCESLLHWVTFKHRITDRHKKGKTRKVIEYQISAAVKIINNTMCNQEIMKHKEHFICYDINIFWQLIYNKSTLCDWLLLIQTNHPFLRLS